MVCLPPLPSMNFDLVHIFHRHGRLRRSQKHKPWHCGPGTSEGDVPNPENSQVCWQMLALRIFHPGNGLFWGERLKAFISAPSSHPARSWDHDGSCHFGAFAVILTYFNVKHPRDRWCLMLPKLLGVKNSDPPVAGLQSGKARHSAEKVRWRQGLNGKTTVIQQL